MPKRAAIALTVTGLALVLLLSFRTPDESAAGSSPSGTGAAVAGPTTPATSPAPAPSLVPGAAATPTPRATTEPGSQGGTGLADRQVTGPVVSTRWGPVQVSVTIQDGRIADVTALQLPSGDRRSSEISAYAEPILRSSAIDSQSADIDTVSGATYTSQAYRQSLQAALDQAAG